MQNVFRQLLCWLFKNLWKHLAYRNVWGYKLVCNPCKKGHHHAKRHATRTKNKTGVSFDAELMYSRRWGDWGVGYWLTWCDVEWLACSNLHNVCVTNNWNPMPLQFWIKIWDWHPRRDLVHLWWCVSLDSTIVLMIMWGFAVCWCGSIS